MRTGTSIGTPIVVCALALYTVVMAVVDLVFDWRPLGRTRGRRRWLPRPYLIVLTLLVLALAVLAFGVN